MKQKNNANLSKEYSVELTEEEVAIVKAGLQYYLLDNAYGLSLWRTIPEIGYGDNDLFYRFRASEIYRKLNKVTKVKPDYGEWSDIKRLVKLCRQNYKMAKRDGEEKERVLFEENFSNGRKIDLF